MLELRRLLGAARMAGDPHAELLVLTTATRSGEPSARLLSLKGLVARGVVFVTDARSAKVAELDANPRACALFTWRRLNRQVTLRGRVERAGDELASHLFLARPRSAQLASWASHQSSVIGSFDELLVRVRDLAIRWPTASDIPVPPHWYAGMLEATSLEFLHVGRPDRLHDRRRYVREAGSGWRHELLSP